MEDQDTYILSCSGIRLSKGENKIEMLDCFILIINNSSKLDLDIEVIVLSNLI